MRTRSEEVTTVGHTPAVVTFGETMVLLSALSSGRMRHVERFVRSCGGAESNFAIALARLGIPTGWFSRLGSDEFGIYIRNTLRGEGLDVSRVIVDPDRPTGLFFKEQPRNQVSQVCYYRKGSAASALTPEDLDETYLASAGHLHLSGITLALSKSARATVDRAIEIANAAGVSISFDANVRRTMCSEEVWREELTKRLGHVQSVFLTSSEARLVTGQDGDESSAATLHDQGIAEVVIKHGVRGAFISHEGGQFWQEAVRFTGLVQPHGAGDAFAAGMLAGRILGWEMEKRGHLAALLGGLATTVSGNVEALPSLAEAEVMLSGTAPNSR